jgi:hypothetical protein
MVLTDQAENAFVHAEPSLGMDVANIPACIIGFWVVACSIYPFVSS